MGEYSGAFVAFDVAKAKHAVAVAESGRAGEIRFVGEIENTPATIARTIKKLAARHGRLQVCYEAGPTGYGLYRQIRELGHDCMVVAPSLIPQRPGERVKTNRRDAVTLARLYRAGELSGVWVSLPREGQRNPQDSPRGPAQSSPRYCLEGTDPIVRPLSPPERWGQEAAGGHRRDRTRDRRLSVGHRPRGRTGVNCAIQPKLHRSGGGAAEGNSRR